VVIKQPARIWRLLRIGSAAAPPAQRTLAGAGPAPPEHLADPQMASKPPRADGFCPRPWAASESARRPDHRAAAWGTSPQPRPTTPPPVRCGSAELATVGPRLDGSSKKRQARPGPPLLWFKALGRSLGAGPPRGGVGPGTRLLGRSCSRRGGHITASMLGRGSWSISFTRGGLKAAGAGKSSRLKQRHKPECA